MQPHESRKGRSTKSHEATRILTALPQKSGALAKRLGRLLLGCGFALRQKLSFCWRLWRIHQKGTAQARTVRCTEGQSHILTTGGKAVCQCRTLLRQSQFLVPFRVNSLDRFCALFRYVSTGKQLTNNSSILSDLMRLPLR
jgi:hypothetical protein